MKLTIFYDGTCPLCKAEMDMLKRYDEHAMLTLENIHEPDFKRRYPQIDVTLANTILHGIDENRKLLLGLDVTVAAWAAVNRKKWLIVLRWPVIRWFADRAYLWFAKHRMFVSSLILGTKKCSID